MPNVADSSGANTAPKRPAKKAPAKKPAGPKKGTPEWFARQVLAGIGAPRSQGNVDAMLSWMAQEGGHWNNSADFNPLNTTQNMPGSGDTGEQGNISVYRSWDQGVKATVETLRNGRYGSVIAGFKGNKPGQALDAVVNSPWGTKSITANGRAYANTRTRTGGGGSYTSAGGGGSNVHLSDKDLAARYGFTAEFLKATPGIHKLVQRAVKEGWEDDIFLGHLKTTRWWRQHSTTQREWVLLQYDDPKEAERQRNQRANAIGTMATGLGLKLDPARIAEISEQSLRWGWDEARLQQAVGKEFDYDPDKAYRGVAGSTIGQIQQLASAYLVPLSDRTMGAWTEQVLRGLTTVDGFENYVKEQAKSLYPYLSDQLDSGVTVAQYADPYRQVAAQTLGVTPDSVDLSKPMWQAPLTQVDKDTGKRYAMSLADWQTKLRTDQAYGFDNSAPAREQAAQFATQLAQQFGAIG